MWTNFQISIVVALAGVRDVDTHTQIKYTNKYEKPTKLSRTDITNIFLLKKIRRND